MSDENESNIPSPVRLSRVEKVLEGEDKYKYLVKPKAVEVTGRGGTKLKFSQAVVDISVALVKEKQDPATCKKVAILAMAARYTSKQSSSSEPAHETSVTDGTGAAPASEAGTAEQTAEQTAGIPKKPLDETDVNHMTAVFSLTMSIRQLLCFDKQPDADRRKRLCEELAASARALV